MKAIKNILPLILVAALFSSCEKKDYPLGLPEYEHHYYAAWLPNNNSQVNVPRSQTAPVKLAFQFYSSFTREYNAVAHYTIVTEGIASPAVAGVDFHIVDRNGTVLQPQNGVYSITFEQAKKRTDTIYVQPLNNTAPGNRKMEVQFLENKTEQYYVDIFSTAFRRPVEFR